MNPLVFPLPGDETMARSFSQQLGAEIADWAAHRFPDGEFYVRNETPVQGRSVLLFSSLKDPDGKALSLLFLAATLRDQGAKQVILIAPYLPYLRQDAVFRPGEGVTSRYFARFLSGFLDGIVTVDPHLHRYSSLSEIYSIPTRVVHAGTEIAEWIRARVPRALVIGPDRESEQWARSVAQGAHAPSLVLDKVRTGDREVAIQFPRLDEWKTHNPVIIDDIVSSANTMIEAVRQLKQSGFASVVCVGVHGIFAGDAYPRLLQAGAATVVTCNTIPHATNQIDLSRPLAEGARELLPG